MCASLCVCVCEFEFSILVVNERERKATWLVQLMYIAYIKTRYIVNENMK